MTTNYTYCADTMIEGVDRNNGCSPGTRLLRLRSPLLLRIPTLPTLSFLSLARSVFKSSLSMPAGRCENYGRLDMTPS